MRHSEQIHEIATALAKAQAAFAPIKKSRTATVQSQRGSYRYHYADLDATLAALTPALNANGIALVQGANTDGDAVVVETWLIHSSGQWIADSLCMVPRDNSPQSIGSAITYARRYLVSALCGVASEEDDDGESAQHERPRQPSRADQAADAIVTDADRKLEIELRTAMAQSQSEADLEALVPRIQAAPRAVQERLRPEYAQHKQRLRAAS